MESTEYDSRLGGGITNTKAYIQFALKANIDERHTSQTPCYVFIPGRTAQAPSDRNNMTHLTSRESPEPQRFKGTGSSWLSDDNDVVVVDRTCWCQRSLTVSRDLKGTTGCKRAIR